MNAWVSLDQAIEIDPLEAALMDIARALQLTPTQHRQAEQHYTGLARHVEHSNSALKDKVPDIYPSGSFAIHAAVRSSISRDQHDVDAVLELDVPAGSDPEWVLDTLYAVIRGERGSRYYDYKIERHSRCVTVTYPDGVTVDLMPVVPVDGAPERVATLFHHKPEDGERYHKEVNPKGFANYFNERVDVSYVFARRFDNRRRLIEGRTYGEVLASDGFLNPAEIIAERADTAPMPAYTPLDQKSPRVVALQLLKRYRDKRYRKLDGRKGLRKPPSVVMAAMALDAGLISDSLYEELIRIATQMRNEIVFEDQANRTLQVFNPAHPSDEFTDRWPEDRPAQRLWAADLKHLIEQLETLRQLGFDPVGAKMILTDLFGETAAQRAIEQHYTAKTELAAKGRMGITATGQVRPVQKPSAPTIITGVSATSLITPARANTNMGGCIPDDDN